MQKILAKKQPNEILNNYKFKVFDNIHVYHITNTYNTNKIKEYGLYNLRFNLLNNESLLHLFLKSNNIVIEGNKAEIIIKYKNISINSNERIEIDFYDKNDKFHILNRLNNDYRINGFLSLNILKQDTNYKDSILKYSPEFLQTLDRYFKTNLSYEWFNLNSKQYIIEFYVNINDIDKTQSDIEEQMDPETYSRFIYSNMIKDLIGELNLNKSHIYLKNNINVPRDNIISIIDRDKLK